MLIYLLRSEKVLFLLLPKTTAFLHAFKMALEDVQILTFPFTLPLPLKIVSEKT